MKFFVPAATADNAEQIYSAIKEHCQQFVNYPITNTRIYSIDFVNDRKSYTATVGHTLDLNNEKVFAIFSVVGAINSILIATVSRGVKGGQPIQISRSASKDIALFDAP